MASSSDVTEDDIIAFAAGLPGVRVLTASGATGAPEIAWGDSFIYYDPDRDLPDESFPFATIVIKDYPGFDEASNVNRPDVFRLNISVGRRSFEGLFGYPPAAQAEHEATVDHTALDTVIPHPVYAKQGWVCILNPAKRTADQARMLLTEAHGRAATRHRPRP